LTISGGLGTAQTTAMGLILLVNYFEHPMWLFYIKEIEFLDGADFIAYRAPASFHYR
jgi:hypothetical protein